MLMAHTKNVPIDTGGDVGGAAAFEAKQNNRKTAPLSWSQNMI